MAAPLAPSYSDWGEAHMGPRCMAPRLPAQPGRLTRAGGRLARARRMAPLKALPQMRRQQTNRRQDATLCWVLRGPLGRYGYSVRFRLARGLRLRLLVSLKEVAESLQSVVVLAHATLDPVERITGV